MGEKVVCIDDILPYDLPKQWIWVRLSAVSKNITDGEHKTPRRVDKFCGYYLLSARNIRDCYLSLDNVDYIDLEEFLVISKRCHPEYGDVLLSCSGSVGRACVITDNSKYAMVRSAAVISPTICDSKFLMYSIQSPVVQTQIKDSIKQAVQANLFQGAIRQLLIPLPPLAEQQRIVAKIEELMSLVKTL